MDEDRVAGRRLKRCPFCGNEAHVYKNMADMWCCGCNIAGRSGGCGIAIIRIEKADAIRDWNKRVRSDD